MRHRGILLSFLGATALATSCRSPYDDAVIDRRSEQLYGSTTPWYESGEVSIELPQHADLDAYLRYGLQHNGALRGAFHRWRASLERVDQVGWPEPVLTYAGFLRHIETRTGPQRHRISLQQTLPWFGTTGLRSDVAAAEAEGRWWQVVAQRTVVVREIKLAFYEYAYLAQAIRIEEDNLRLLQQLEPVAQRRVQAGGSQEDLLRLQVELGKLENELETLRKFRPVLSARLGAAMNRKRASLLPFPGAVDFEVQEVPAEALLARALDANPELTRLRAEIVRAGATEKLADRSQWPDITLGVDYFETGSAAMPGVADSGEDPIALRVSFSLPVWRGRYDSRVREARRMERAARGQLSDHESRLRFEIEQAVYELDDAGRQIGLYRDTLLPRASQAFEVIQASYRAATATVLDVIDAERTLLAFQKSYWRAVSDYEQSLADIEALCGGEL